MRSPAENDRGGTLRTAGGSTTQKWPERLPSSPGQTERTHGLAASEMDCDESWHYQWTDSDRARKIDEAAIIHPISV